MNFAVDLQHALSQHHWYLGSYRMQFNHPLTEQAMPLFHDADPEATMQTLAPRDCIIAGRCHVDGRLP